MPQRKQAYPGCGTNKKHAQVSTNQSRGGWGEAREQIRNGKSDLKKDYKNNKYNA